jgi:hypothetical protein
MSFRAERGTPQSELAPRKSDRASERKTKRLTEDYEPEQKWGGKDPRAF